MNIRVKVTTGGKKELFKKLKEDVFEISVREKAERNQANRRVVQLIAEHFGILAREVKIVSGHKNKNKSLHINKDKNE